MSALTRQDIRRAVLDTLCAIAPETDPAEIAPNRPLRDQVDLDSMDFLRFVVELHRQLGVEVPEADYAKLASVAAAVDYLSARLAA